MSELPNLAFVWDNASNPSDLFEVGEFQRLYLNFSDPWPKKRTYKRRLTYRGFLQEYRRIMGEDAEIFFKTDNRGLFEFSLNEFCADDWKLSNISLDLHNSDYEGNIMTEYEEKLSSRGMPIYRLEAKGPKIRKKGTPLGMRIHTERGFVFIWRICFSGNESLPQGTAGLRQAEA